MKLSLLSAAMVTALMLGPRMSVAAQDQSACDDLSQQIANANSDLDQLQADAQPWLMSVSQFAAVAPNDLALAGAQGNVPGLGPDLAGSYGAIAAQLGAQVNAWRVANEGRSSDGYWRDLAANSRGWDGTFAVVLPVQPFVPSLGGMSASLQELDQLAAKAAGDLGLSDSLSNSLQQCEASNPPPSGPMGGAPGDPSALCAVGGQSGYSNSECFRLQLDAAYGVWAACTEAYFAAEREAFRTGGDPPANTCDGTFKAAQDALQSRWRSGP
jgi:hypothetical protein